MYFGGGLNEICSGVFLFLRYFFWIFDFRKVFIGFGVFFLMFLVERELFFCWFEEELLFEVDEFRGILGFMRLFIWRVLKIGILLKNIR